jgi:hypothetical protein
VGRAGLELATPCASCRFEPFNKVHVGPISRQLLRLSVVKVRLNTYQFMGVADGVADIGDVAVTYSPRETTAALSQVQRSTPNKQRR